MKLKDYFYKIKNINMKKEIICTNCNSQNIIIENKLFFSEEESEVNIICPICNNHIQTLYTDGWFFIQTKVQFKLDEQIDKQKQKLKFMSEII
jgi:transcription elongation factor Elf1